MYHFLACSTYAFSSPTQIYSILPLVLLGISTSFSSIHSIDHYRRSTTFSALCSMLSPQRDQKQRWFLFSRSQSQDREDRHSSPDHTNGLTVRSSDKGSVQCKYMTKEPDPVQGSGDGFSEMITELSHEETVESRWGRGGQTEKKQIEGSICSRILKRVRMVGSKNGRRAEGREFRH